MKTEVPLRTRLRWWRWAALLATVSGLLLVAANIMGGKGTSSIPAVQLWAAATVGAFFVVGVRLASVRCPRCGEHFFWPLRGTGLLPFVFRDRCGHCGLGLGEQVPAAGSPARKRLHDD